jgi:hypothetical protein
MLRIIFSVIFMLCIIIQASAQKKYPTLDYSTVLNGVHLSYERGLMKLDGLRAVHLPDEESQSAFQYNPEDGGKLQTKVTHLSSSVVFADLMWYGMKQIEPYWTLSKYQVSEKTQPNVEDGWMEIKTKGEYKMEFLLDDDVIFSFPFAIDILPSTSSQDPIDKYMLDGPWEHYAHLFYLGGRPGMNLKFVVWLRNRARRPNKEISVHSTILKTGNPFGSFGTEPHKITVTPEWKRFEFPIGAKIRSETGEMVFKTLRAKSILNEPASYEILLIIDGELYGTYSFTVDEDGFTRIAEQDPEQTKRKDRIYSSDGVVWMKKK